MDDIEQMYLDLTKLLEDICQFLSTDKLGKLSFKDQKIAKSLISRSKKQLQEISKIQCNEDYVVMNGQVNNEEEAKSDIYSSVDGVDLKSLSIIEENNPNPYADLPAKEASQKVKCGIISMKRKNLLRFEVMKKVYATIHEGWLLVYTSEKDAKPLFTFDLRKFEAKESGYEKSNFELVNPSFDKKTYQFLALTHKDMLQWTVQINQCHDDLLLNEKSGSNSANSDTVSEKKYGNVDVESCSDDDEQIYEKLNTVHMKKNEKEPVVPSTQNSTKKPPLPPSRPPLLNKKPKLPIKVLPPVVKSISVSTNSSEGSLVFSNETHTEPKSPITPNISNSNSTKSLDDSFSDENSPDETYETFADVQKYISSKNAGRFDDLAVDETVRKPQLPKRIYPNRTD